MPPKKNLSSLREITRRVKIVSGAAPPPFRIFAGGIPRRLRRRNAFGLIQEYCTTTIKLPLWREFFVRNILFKNIRIILFYPLLDIAVATLKARENFLVKFSVDFKARSIACCCRAADSV